MIILSFGIITLFFLSALAPMSIGYNVKTLNIINDGNTLYVGGSGPGNYSDIQSAINDANNGDTVIVFDYSSPYYENIEIDKSINLVGENKNTTIIDGDRLGDVIYISTDWVNITGFTIQRGEWSHPRSGIRARTSFSCFSNNNVVNNLHGIKLESNSNNNTIIGNNASNNNNGILLGTYDSNNTIIGNKANSNNCYGMSLWQASNNMIIGNTVKSNKNNFGIYINYYCESNIIMGNKLSDNEGGIMLGAHSSNNLVSGNNLTNTGHGVSLSYSDNNMIIGNNASNNFIGIFMQFSGNNLLFHNNLINSSGPNAFADELNFWYNQSIQHGNYYDDYTGVDDDGDGIGDTPYNKFVGGGDNIDIYPLMVPWGENYQPSKPFINGSVNGKPGIEYEYTFNSTDFNEDTVKYFIDWGDSATYWTEYGDSGVEIKLKHTWEESGKYSIKAKAIDIHGEEGNWSEFEVIMSRNRMMTSSFFLRLLEKFPLINILLQKFRI